MNSMRFASLNGGFFGPARFRDEIAVKIFTALHAPLFIAMLAYMESAAFQLGVDLFVIIHGLLHFGLRNHNLIEFDSWFSRFWIFGGFLLAGLHLVLVLWPG